MLPLIVHHDVKYLREADDMALDMLLADGIEGIVEEKDEDY
jgi:hypothetical protein